VFEVVADLTAGRVLSVVERKGVEPPVMASEFETAKVVLAHRSSERRSRVAASPT
jgi:hypothetical protein